MEMNQYFYEYQPLLMYIPQFYVINYQPAQVYSEHVVLSSNFELNTPNPVDSSHLVITHMESNYYPHEMDQIAIYPQFTPTQMPIPDLNSHQPTIEVELEQCYNGEYQSFLDAPPNQCNHLNEMGHVTETSEIPSQLNYIELDNASAQANSYSSEENSQSTTDSTIRINDNITHTHEMDLLGNDNTVIEFVDTIEGDFFDFIECSSVEKLMMDECRKPGDRSPVTSTPVRALKFPVDCLYNKCNDCNEYYGERDNGIELQCLCYTQIADS